MAEMAPSWAYDENEMEQLGQKLLYTTLELDRLRTEAMEEMNRNKEHISTLFNLLQFAIKQRDEARTQFQNLLSKNPLFQQNSSVTESNSLSDPYINYHSPVDSIFDAAVSSPEFSNINHHHHPFVDQEQLIIDTLAQGKVLPENGKFLQAVIQAGPLLQSLMVAGPLPRWRNPPQPLPTFQIPPVPIKPCESDPFSYKEEAFSPLSAQIQSAPPALMNGNNGYSPFAKRQRFS